jgi:hypothetical protein
LLLLTQQPQIILLKEGTDSSQGKGQLISNINACAAVVDTVRTTLGPRGMDKLMVDERGKYQNLSVCTRDSSVSNVLPKAKSLSRMTAPLL